MARPLLLLLVLAAAARAEDHALLVGCTEYPHLRKDNERLYKASIRLFGPANDVALMRDTLVDHLGVAARNITVLQGWRDGAKDNPTRGNILAQLDRLAEVAHDGDQVIVFLAGHGSQQPDASGDEPDGMDEIFLPADVKGWQGQKGQVENSITDDEIAAKVRAIRAAGARVWLLMDCCHAGTMVRGAETYERSRRIDPALLGVPEGARTRGGGGAERSTLDDLEGVACLYAAPAHRLAPEMQLPRDSDDAEWHGLFSYSVAAALRRTRGRTTFRELHAHVVAAYQALPYLGTAPVAEGDLDLAILGGRADRPPLWVKRLGDEVVLNAGRLTGVAPGARLRVLEAGGKELGFVDVASAEITRATCRAGALKLDEGAVYPVEIVSAPAGDLRIRVAVAAAGELPAEVGACFEDHRWVRVAREADADWLLQVVPDGTMRMRPARAGSAVSFLVAPGGLESALERIYRVRNLRRFAAGTARGLPAGLTFRMRRIVNGQPEPVAPGSVVRPGEQIDIELRNLTGEAYDLAVFVLDAHYGITELFPRYRSARSNAADKEPQVLGPFPVVDSSLGTEHLLVFAVPAEGPDEVNLGWLAQGSLRTRGALDPVGAFLGELAYGSKTRGLGAPVGAFHASLFSWRTEWGDVAPPAGFGGGATACLAPRHCAASLARTATGAAHEGRGPRFRGDLSVLYAKLAPSVVVVRTRVGHGTGFLVGKDLVLTNHHVVAAGFSTNASGRAEVRAHRGRLHEEGWMRLDEADVAAEIVARDEERDLALLRVQAPPAWFEGMAPVELAAKGPGPGAECALVGHPSAGILWTLREGRVAQVGRMPQDLVDALVARLARGGAQAREQLDAMTPTKIVLSQCDANPGDSGSPLVDREGRLLGITYAIPQDVRTDKFVYHVHVDVVREFLARTRAEGPEVPDAWRLGPNVALTTSDPALAAPDILVAGTERPTEILIDVDGDARPDPAKLAELVRGRGFDAEVALHFAGDRKLAFYDSDNDGAFDVVLVDEDDDPEADVRFTLRDGKWKVEVDLDVHWLSSHYLTFKGGAAAAQKKFLFLRTKRG